MTVAPYNDFRVRPPTPPEWLEQPHDDTAEQYLLGALLCEPGQYDKVIGIVCAKDFYQPCNRVTFEAIAALHAAGEPVDAATVRSTLVAAGNGSKLPSPGYLLELMHETPTWVDARFHAGTVADRAQRRALAVLAYEATVPTVDMGDVHARLREALDRPLGNRFTLDEMSADELDQADLKLTWLCEGILVAGAATVIGGPQKTFKTSVAADLAVSLAAGRKFLGRFWVPEPKRVLFVSAESGRSNTQDLLRRVCKARGTTLSALGDNLLVSFALPNLTTDEHLAAIRRVIKERQIDVVILDPAYMMLFSEKLSASNLFEMGAALRRITEAALELNVTLVICHHYIKAGARQTSIPSLSDLTMTGFAEYAAQWILMGRRDTETMEEPWRLWLVCGGRAQGQTVWEFEVTEGRPATLGGRVWDVQVGEPETKAVVADKLRSAVLDFCMLHPAGFTKSLLESSVSGKTDRKRDMLEVLVDEGLLTTGKVLSIGGQKREGFIPTPKLARGDFEGATVNGDGEAPNSPRPPLQGGSGASEFGAGNPRPQEGRESSLKMNPLTLVASGDDEDELTF